MRFVDPEEFVNLTRPGVEWLVDRLIPRPGNVMLLGPPKAGKSFLAWDIAARVSRGEPVLGREAKASPVLFLELDTSEHAWRTRLTDMAGEGYNIHAPQLKMVHPEDDLKPLNILDHNGQAFLKEALRGVDPSLVVIDVLREIHTMDENDSTEMKMAFDALQVSLVGRSVLYVHHTKKIPADVVGAPDPVNAARGSSYITGKMDAYMLLYANRLYITSRFEEPYALSCAQTPSGAWAFPSLESAAIIRRTVLDLCSAYPMKSHKQLAREALRQHGLGKRAYYEALAWQPCAHSPGTLQPSHTPAPRDSGE